jgi:excisionase family DNA binding protein
MIATGADCLSVTDTARVLGVSKPTIYRLAKAGAIPHTRVASLLRFRGAAKPVVVVRCERRPNAVIWFTAAPRPTPSRRCCMPACRRRIPGDGSGAVATCWM